TMRLRRRPPPITTLFPYTTLFRSGQVGAIVLHAHPVTNRARVVDREGEGGQAPRHRPIGHRVRGAGLLHHPAAGAIAVIELHVRSEEHTSELQSRENLVCRLLLEK